MNRLVTILGILSLALVAHATEVRKASSPIRVDGLLDEPAWQQATPISIAYEWSPRDDIAAAVPTECLVTFDDDRLYVAFRATDPNPERIIARFTERDAQFDDFVGFVIDPFNDDRRAYQFRVNPLGVQADAIHNDVEGTRDFSWDAIWDSAARITANGYVVEIAVPLQQLRVPSGGAPQTWGFLAMRDWPRDVRHQFRSVRPDPNRNCLVCQFEDVTGFGGTRTGRNVELTPTLTGTNGEGGRTSVEPGLSGRWAITPGTSLQATLNPDFSQVEADAAQLGVNTRFALSFPEKRPFFLEGSDFFETQLPLVFTRSIADPLGGLKLTGKNGPSSYGVLVARDRITNLLVPSDQSSFRTTLPEDSTTAIFRYRRELGKNATVGGLVSSRSGPDYDNRVGSADSYFRLTERDSLRVQLAGSRSEYPAALGARSLDGHAFYANYSHSDRNWTWASDYIELSPGFRADAGLVGQVGVRALSAFAERRVRGGDQPGRKWFSNLYFNGGVDGTQQYDRDWNEWGADLGLTYEGPRQSRVSANLLAPNQEFFAGRVYHNLRHNVSASIQATPDLNVGFSANWGEAIDFTNERAAEFVTLTPSARFDIGRRIHGELSWVRQTFNTDTGDRVFDVDLPQARLLYHFSRRAFLRTILQYRDVKREPGQYTIPVGRRDRGLLSQLLFSYRLDAQTVFLAGYSDNYSGTETIDLTRTNRALFVKLSYAWLF